MTGALKPAPINGELLDRDPNRPIKTGDYVTRGGSDVHYAENVDGDLIRVVCIIPPDSDWIEAGEYEDNLLRQYSHIKNRHMLELAKAEHERLKTQFPDGWIW